MRGELLILVITSFKTLSLKAELQRTGKPAAARELRLAPRKGTRIRQPVLKARVFIAILRRPWEW
jgi:hypothetical protein